MEIYTNARHISKEPTSVALGAFDGVHLGHAAVISRACNAARENSLLSAVFTFSELPRNAFLAACDRIPAICDTGEKARRIAALGVDMLVRPDFTETLRAISPERFVEEILIGCLNAHNIVCGHDHRFGAKGRGDAEMLLEICGRYGVSATIVPPVFEGGERISSTRIRSALLNGDVELAKRLLGRNFSVTAPARKKQCAEFALIQSLNDTLNILPASGAYNTQITAGTESCSAVTYVNNKGRELTSYPSDSFSIGNAALRVEFCNNAVSS